MNLKIYTELSFSYSRKTLNLLICAPLGAVKLCKHALAAEPLDPQPTCPKLECLDEPLHKCNVLWEM